MLRALEFGHKTSGKPWKGLSRLVDLAVYSGVDPEDARMGVDLRYGVCRARRLHARARARVDRARLSARQAPHADRRQDRAGRSMGRASARPRLAVDRLSARRTRAGRVRTAILEVAGRVSRQHGGRGGRGSPAVEQGVPSLLHAGRRARAGAIRRANGRRRCSITLPRSHGETAARSTCGTTSRICFRFA